MDSAESCTIFPCGIAGEIYCRHFRLRFRLGSQCHLVKEEMWPYGLDGMADMVFLCRIAGEITCLRFRLRASTRPGSQGYLDKDQMRTDTVSILASPEDSARTNKIEYRRSKGVARN